MLLFRCVNLSSHYVLFVTAAVPEGGLVSGGATRQPPLLPLSSEDAVKRQAAVELQKVVSAAETKASELLAAERAKMERMLSEARRQAAEETLAAINHQEESTEVWFNPHLQPITAFCRYFDLPLQLIHLSCISTSNNKKQFATLNQTLSEDPKCVLNIFTEISLKSLKLKSLSD